MTDYLFDLIDSMLIAFRLNTSRMRLIPLVYCQGFIAMLATNGGLNRDTNSELKFQPARIVAMLTRLANNFDGVSETLDKYTLAVDYEHEHRDAEHEHEEMPEPGVGPKPRKLAF